MHKQAEIKIVLGIADQHELDQYEVHFQGDLDVPYVFLQGIRALAGSVSKWMIRHGLDSELYDVQKVYDTVSQLELAIDDWLFDS